MNNKESKGTRFLSTFSYLYRAYSYKMTEFNSYMLTQQPLDLRFNTLTKINKSADKNEDNCYKS